MITWKGKTCAENEDLDSKNWIEDLSMKLEF